MRILVLTHRLPYAPNRGDRLRLFHILKHLRPRAAIELVSLVHDRDEESRASDMNGLADRVTALRVPWLRTHIAGVARLGTQMPLTHSLLDATGFQDVLNEIVANRPPDVVFAYCSGMARWGVVPPLNTIPLIVDFVDMDSQKWRELAAASRPPLSWVYRREARTLEAFESVAATQAAASLVINDREAAIARRIAPAATVQVVTNGVETERLRPSGPPSPSSRVVFCGVMNYAPNHAAMMWFVRAVWPRVLAGRPDATLAIVGSDPQRDLAALCAAFPSIQITGRVDDVRPWLWESALSVAPLHVARGLQNKVLEAIAAGLPVVITQAVAAGLPAAAATATVVADSAPQFSDAVLAMLNRTPLDRRAIAESFDLASLSWPETLRPVWAAIEAASRSSGKSRPL